ncbi:MAG: (2Fe-2S)-binding protein, partial [Planctomycetota bacterium]
MASSQSGHADYCNPALYEATRRHVEQAVTLPPDSYRDEEFYRVERQRVWARSWVAVGYECQVPNAGDCITVEVADQPLFVLRDRSGGLRAFYNVCRHRGSRLLKQHGNCKVIRCPYHGWGYSLEGQLLGTPYFKGLDVPAGMAEKFAIADGVAEDFCKDDYPLLAVRCERWAGIIFVNLDDAAMPLAEWLGDLPQRYARHPLAELKLVRRRDYRIGANWKLIAENFMEYYHLPWGHPELCNISGFDNHWRYQGPGMYCGMCTSPLSDDPNTLTVDLPPFTELTYTESKSAYFVHLFPNISLWIFPHHFLTLLFRPSGPATTLEHVDMLVHPDVLTRPGIDESLDRIMKFWCFVNDQDVELVEGVQAGVAARAYRGGRLCYRFEEPIHRFQNMLIDLMT